VKAEGLCDGAQSFAFGSFVRRPVGIELTKNTLGPGAKLQPETGTIAGITNPPMVESNLPENGPTVLKEHASLTSSERQLLLLRTG